MPRVRLFVGTRISEAAEVEEILQETFVTAFVRLASYRPEGTLINWLVGIAANHLHANRRRIRRTRSAEGDALEILLENERQRRETDAEAAKFLQGTTLERLHDCLGRLAPWARSLVLARHAEGRSLQDLAASQDKQPGTLAMALCRIRATLRACIGREESLS